MDAIGFSFPCVVCGANLQAAAVAGICPACGHPIAEMLRGMSVDPASGTVNGDVPCTACGYNLRTLAMAAACPECNTAVRDSLRREDIQLNSIPWLRRMCRGLTLLICAVPVFVVLIVFEERLPAFVLSWFSGSIAAARLGYVAQGLAAAAVYAGILMVTQRHRGVRRTRSQSLACRLARILPIVAACLEIALTFGALTVLQGTASGWFGQLFVFGALTEFVFAVEILIVICVGVRLRAAVGALGGRGLRWATTSVIWVCGVTGFVYVLEGIFELLVFERLTRQGAGASGASNVAAVLDWLFSVFVYVASVARFAELVFLVAFVVAFVALIECRIILGRRLSAAIAGQKQNTGANTT